MNNTIYFNPEWLNALDFLHAEVRDCVISAIITYQVTGELPKLKNSNAVLGLMKIEVDARNRRLAKAKATRAAKKEKKDVAPPPTADEKKPEKPFPKMEEEPEKSLPKMEEKPEKPLPKMEEKPVNPIEESCIQTPVGAPPAPRLIFEKSGAD